ncbi:hypothetical protein NMY22_g2553 [Coprinellus aureogranulatus]|nr:hypothetical protein NMY22_g2553 [Coprinellus aureogranulatus]
MSPRLSRSGTSTPFTPLTYPPHLPPYGSAREPEVAFYRLEHEVWLRRVTEEALEVIHNQQHWNLIPLLQGKDVVEQLVRSVRLQKRHRPAVEQVVFFRISLAKASTSANKAFETWIVFSIGIGSGSKGQSGVEQLEPWIVAGQDVKRNADVISSEDGEGDVDGCPHSCTMGRKQYSCPCPNCGGTMHLAKTIIKHLQVEIPPGEAFGDWLAGFLLEHRLSPGESLPSSARSQPRRTPAIASSDNSTRATPRPVSPEQVSGEAYPTEMPFDEEAPVRSSPELSHAAGQPQPNEDIAMDDDTQKSDVSMDDVMPAAPNAGEAASGIPELATTSAAARTEADSQSEHSSTHSIHLTTFENVDIPPPADDSRDEENEPDQEAVADLRHEDAERAAAVQAEEERRDHQPFTGREIREEVDIAPSMIEAIETTRAFINEIRAANLDNGKLNKASVEALKNPVEELDELAPAERLHLKLYMSHLKTSQEVYNETAEAINEYSPDANVPSFKQMENRVRNITGITTITDDMCPNSCLAFTGPFTNHSACPMCGAERYLETSTGKRVPRKSMTTLPLGMHLAALKKDPQSCKDLLHGFQETERILEEREEQEPKDYVYNDIFSGSDFQEFAERVELTEDDFVVGLSLDGAQLYQNKTSDTWIGVWTVYNYSPKQRYKRKHILPAFIVPGPNKPKNIDSLTFRSLHHLSALQRHDDGAGIKVWDARKKAVVQCRTFFFVQTADAPAMVYMDGRVGHHGAHGCRLGCSMKGRHDKGTGFYYAVHLKPNNYTVKGCDHPDIDLRQAKFEPCSPTHYDEQVNSIVTSSTQKEYERRRLASGIGKPSILSGLSPNHTLALPKCFSLDLMHLLFINIPDLLVPLWRGVPLKKGEDTKKWGDWVCLTGDVWKEHGRLVGDATRYFPSSFHRPPRNPAEKINSGYKATEYYLYLFGLGPGFFRTVLPKKYWQHFCKLVKGVHIILQRSLTAQDIRKAQSLFVQYVSEFEHLYYQRRADRLHFCRPWLHTLLHTPFEVTRMGPNGNLTQFTMECAIGDYGREIRQPSDPYGNLARILERQSHLNALKSMYPEELDKDNKKSKKPTLDGGDGFTLLHPASKRPENVGGEAGRVMQAEASITRVTVWERLSLPNGQVIRSLRKDARATKRTVRVTRNAKIYRNNAYQYAEIQFYFRCQPDPINQPEKWEVKALVSLYTPPNPTLLEESCGTLHACRYTGEDGFAVISVKEMISLVAMIPLPTLPDEVEYRNMFFPVEKSGLEVTDFTV